MIKLLDNSEWNKDELKLKMYDDSFYYGYLGKNALSSSSAKPLYKSPHAYKRFTRENISGNKAIREGKLFHTLLLEEEKIQHNYLFVDSSTRTTKKFKDAELDNPHLEVMTNRELESMSYLISTFESNVEASEFMRKGVAEEPGIDTLFDFPFRAKADYLRSDMIIDIKTTQTLDGWGYKAKKVYHYDMQAYIYTKIFQVQNFVFLVIDKSTGEIKSFPVTQETLDGAEKKVQIACETYKDYMYDKTKSINQYLTTEYL